MSEKIEIQGKTLEEAKLKAASALDISVEELQYEILENATNGIFGIGAKQCKILAWSEGKDIAKVAEGFLNKILPLMSVRGQASAKVGNDILEVSVEGENMGVVIGKRGETLDALQYLTNLTVSRHFEDRNKFILDVEGYRAKREETLERLAKKLAERVKESGKNMSLEPMSPYERRIIHTVLQSDEQVRTFSEGEEPYRKVVIAKKK